MRLRVYSVGLFAIIFTAVASYFAWNWVRDWSSQQQEEEARHQLAFESLEERLPKGKPIPPGKPLGTEARKRWESLNGTLADFQGQRSQLLQALHEKTQRFFVDSPGQGSGRDLRITPEMI